MGRKGGSIYVSTDPNNNVPIGVEGQGVAIGALGRSIYGTGSGGKESGGGAGTGTIPEKEAKKIPESEAE